MRNERDLRCEITEAVVEAQALLDQPITTLDLEKKRKKRLKQLDGIISWKRSVLRYLETSPRHESITKQIDRLEKKLNQLDQIFIQRTDRTKDLDKTRKEIARMKSREGYSKMVNQLHTLKYILNEKAVRT